MCVMGCKIVGIGNNNGADLFLNCYFFSELSTARGHLATPTRAPGGTRAPEDSEASASEFLSAKSKLQIFF